jgi:hypothetical protein
MPREIALGDALAPGLLVAFVLSLALFWLLDWVFGRLGLFHRVWHPPLFRLALFVCVFCSTGLLLF